MKNSKQELIIEVAQKLFARYGFKKTTIDEIARLAHIAKGGIYYYFDSKEDIFRAVLEKENRLWNKSCLLYTSPSPRDLSTSRMPSSA